MCSQKYVQRLGAGRGRERRSTLAVNDGIAGEISKGNDSLSSVLEVDAGLSGRQCTRKFSRQPRESMGIGTFS